MMDAYPVCKHKRSVYLYCLSCDLDEKWKWGRLLRRKAVLDNYGITIENVTFDEWCEILGSDDRLNTHWGEPMQDCIMKELNEIDNPTPHQHEISEEPWHDDHTHRFCTTSGCGFSEFVKNQS